MAAQVSSMHGEGSVGSPHTGSEAQSVQSRTVPHTTPILASPGSTLYVAPALGQLKQLPHEAHTLIWPEWVPCSVLFPPP